jgi:large subunit ribosomal protein L9
MLADALKEMGVVIDRKHITMKGDAIKETGTYEAEVEFHREVKQTLQFEVVAE